MYLPPLGAEVPKIYSITAFEKWAYERMIWKIKTNMQSTINI